MTKITKDGEAESKKAEEAEGAKKTTKEVLIGPEEGPPNFAMRRFTLKSDGQSPLHTHEWEHEVYVLEGEGRVITEDGPRNIKPGDAVYVEPGEKHQFKTERGLVFLCMVPNRGEPSFE